MTNEKEQCDLCKKTKHEFLYQTKDRLLGICGVFYLYKCSNCGLRFLKPQPSSDELKKFYPKNYMPYNYNLKDWRDKLELSIYKILNKSIIKHIFYPLNFFIRRGLTISKKGRLLDIGCGSGNFLNISNVLGMEAYGIDISTDIKNASFKDGVKIYNQDIEQFDFPKNYFDVITLNHVLEHLPHTHKILKKLKKIIKPRGTIIIQIPSSTSLNSLIFGKFYPGVDSPRHLYIFNKKNIKKYCDLLELKIQKTKYRVPSTNNNIIMGCVYLVEYIFFKEKTSRHLRKILNNIFFKIMLYPFSVLLCLLKLGDGLEVYIYKK